MDSVSAKDGKLEIGEKKFTTEAVELSSGFALQKPVIDSEKLLEKDEQSVVEFALKKQGRMLVHCEVKHAKNDYVGDYDRGTVEYTTRCRNYSFHKVIVPDGTTIKESNFTQRGMGTQAIIGKSLTFIGCNLVNNVIDQSWTLVDCNDCQVDFEAREKEKAESLKEVI